jgi:hypothetical protein
MEEYIVQKHLNNLRDHIKLNTFDIAYSELDSGNKLVKDKFKLLYVIEKKIDAIKSLIELSSISLSGINVKCIHYEQDNPIVSQLNVTDNVVTFIIGSELYKQAVISTSQLFSEMTMLKQLNLFKSIFSTQHQKLKKEIETANKKNDIFQILSNHDITRNNHELESELTQFTNEISFDECKNDILTLAFNIFRDTSSHYVTKMRIRSIESLLNTLERYNDELEIKTSLANNIKKEGEHGKND